MINTILIIATVLIFAIFALHTMSTFKKLQLRIEKQDNNEAKAQKVYETLHRELSKFDKNYQTVSKQIEEFQVLYAKVNQSLETLSEVNAVSNSGTMSNFIKSTNHAFGMQSVALNEMKSEIDLIVQTIKHNKQTSTNDEFLPFSFLKDEIQKLNKVSVHMKNDLSTVLNQIQSIKDNQFHPFDMMDMSRNTQSNQEESISSKFKHILNESKYIQSIMGKKRNDNEESDLINYIHNLSNTLGYMEQKIISDLYTQGLQLNVVKEDNHNLHNNMVQLLEKMKIIQGDMKDNNNMLHRNLEAIISELSPFQSGSLTKLNNAIKDIDKKINEFNLNKNGVVGNAPSQQLSSLQESMDALSDYFSLSQQQIFDYLNITNKKMSKLSKLTLDTVPENIEHMEKQMVKYLSFVYQEMQKQTVNSDENYTNALQSFQNISKLLEESQVANKKYFTVLYHGLESK